MSPALWVKILLGAGVLVGLGTVVGVSTYRAHHKIEKAGLPDTSKPVPVIPSRSVDKPTEVSEKLKRLLEEAGKKPGAKPSATPTSEEKTFSFLDPSTWTWEEQLSTYCDVEQPEAVVYRKMQRLPMACRYHIIPLKGGVEFLNRDQTRKFKVMAGEPDKRVPFEAEWIRAVDGEKAVVQAKLTPRPSR